MTFSLFCFFFLLGKFQSLSVSLVDWHLERGIKITSFFFFSLNKFFLVCSFFDFTAKFPLKGEHFAFPARSMKQEYHQNSWFHLLLNKNLFLFYFIFFNFYQNTLQTFFFHLRNEFYKQQYAQQNLKRMKVGELKRKKEHITSSAPSTR